MLRHPRRKSSLRAGPLVALLGLLGGVFLPAEPALGASRMFPARYAPGVEDLGSGRVLTLKEAAGVEGVNIQLHPSGGRLRGRILGTETGLEGVWVEASSGGLTVIGLTDFEGEFSLEGVPAGAAILRASTDSPNSREQGFAALYFPGVLTEAEATDISVANGEDTRLPDWTLPVGGVLRGGLTAESFVGTSVSDVELQIYREVDGRLYPTRSGADGGFVFHGLSSGDYRVGVIPGPGSEFLPSWSGGGRSLETASSILVQSGSEQRVDLSLDLGGQILGQLRTEGSNEPYVGRGVQAISQSTAEVFAATSDGIGAFRFVGLPGDSYLIFAPFMNRYYPGVTQKKSARPVSVGKGDSAARIDIEGFDLDQCSLGQNIRGVIRGTVELDFETFAGGVITATSSEDTLTLAVETIGSYIMDCVPTGDYRVGLLPQGPFVSRFYDDADDLAEAEWISVDADTVGGIAFEQIDASWVAGTVKDSAGEPLAQSGVSVLNLSGERVAVGTTDEMGAFRIDRLLDGSGLPAGDYYVRAESTLVADPEVTPVLQPRLSFSVEEHAVHLSWQFDEQILWEYSVHRVTDTAGNGTDVETDTGADELLFFQPLGAMHRSAWLDRPPPGEYRYRLEARGFDQNGNPMSSLLESWTDWVSVRHSTTSAPERIQAWPVPWNGQGRMQFRDVLPSTLSAGLHQRRGVDIVGPDGRQLRRLVWPDGAEILSWDGRDSQGMAVASGVYFARRWTEPRGIPSGTMIVVQR